MTLDRHVCFGTETSDYIQGEVQHWTKAVRTEIDRLCEDEVQQLLLDALDLLLAKENPTWSDYRFLATVKDKIDAVLG